MDEPLVSVVISSKNRLNRLTALLESLRRQNGPPIETILVDDGSDPSLPPLPVTLQLRNETSLGMCSARNQGIQLAHGRCIVVLDDDTSLPDPQLLANAVATAHRIQNVDAIGFRQLTPEGKAHVMQPAPGNSLCRASHFFGYGFLLSREAIERVGLFYSPLGYYQEEIELGYRLLDAGYTILYDPNLSIIHYEETANRDYRKIHRLSFRNSMYIAVLRYPAWLVLPSLLRSLVAYVRLTRSWKIFSLADVAWAFRSLVGTFPALLRDRKPVRYETLKRARAANRGEPLLVEAIPTEQRRPPAPN